MSVLEKKFKNFFWNLVGSRINPGISVPLNLSSSISILVFRPDRLGDFILSLPAFLEIQKKMDSSARLTLITGERNAEIAKFFFPEARIWVFRKGFVFRLGLWTRLWLSRFDVVLDFHSYPFSTTSSLMTLLSGAPRRIGFWASGDFRKYSGLSKKIFNWGVSTPGENLPEAEKSLLLVKKMIPGFKKKDKKIPLPDSRKEVIEGVDRFYAEIGADSKTRIVGIHPTLQKKDNRWSQDKYLEVLQDLSAIPGLKVVVIHGKGEERELKRFQEAINGLSNVFIIPTDDIFFILESAKRFKLLLCNDSGMMHVCALVTKIFGVFGPSEPSRWGPLDPGGFHHRIFRTKNQLCDSVGSMEVAREIKKSVQFSR